MNLNRFYNNRGISIQAGILATSFWSEAVPSTTIQRVTSAAWSPDLLLYTANTPDDTDKIHTSIDGYTWEGHTGISNEMRRIIWCRELGMFIAVNDDSGSDDNTFTSIDGVNWSVHSNPNGRWMDLAWSPSLGILVSVSRGGTNYVRTSTDGISWTERTISGGAQEWWGVTWSQELGKFCAVGVESGSSAGRTAISQDGINWERNLSADESNNWRKVVWASELGLFVAVGDGGASHTIMTSKDGEDWTGVHSLGSWDDIAWSPELSLFVVTGSEEYFLTSYDGKEWTQRSSLSGEWETVLWSAELGIFTAFSLSGVTTITVSRTKEEIEGAGGLGPSLYTSGEAISDRDVVGVYDGSGGESFDAGKVLVASKDATHRANVIGFALSSVGADEEIEVHTGGILDGFSGLTPGVSVFLGNNGTITQDVDDIALGEYRTFLGYAKSATEIEVMVSEGIFVEFNNMYWDSIPLGSLVFSSTNYVREGFVRPDGRELSRTNYSELNALYEDEGYPHGNGDGSTTFNIPDYEDPSLIIKVRYVEAKSEVEQVAVDTRLLELEETSLFVPEVRGYKVGYDINFDSNDEFTIQPGVVHVYNSSDGSHVMVTKPSSSLLVIAETTPGWYPITINQAGVISPQSAVTGSASERPTAAILQYPSGYDFIAQGYYHSAGNRIIGVVYRIDANNYYVIQMGPARSERGENSNGHWRVESSGLQTCRVETTATLALSSLNQGNYRNAGGTWVGTWPKAFAALPTILPVGGDTQSVHSVTMQGGFTTETEWSILAWVGASSTSASRAATLFAIGDSA